MPASAWLGLSDAPGEATGLGPLDAWTCRDLAAQLAAGGSRTRWLVTLTGRGGQAVAHAAARAGPGPPGTRQEWLGKLRFDWLERGRCSHLRVVYRYQPDRGLRNLIRARHRTCTFPGCLRPPRPVISTIRFRTTRAAGHASATLPLLCRRHHHVKQADGWTLTQPEPGTLIWAAPHGRSYAVTPASYVV